MICNLEYVKVTKNESSLFLKIQTNIDLSNTKEKKAFFRENSFSLFQVKIDDRNSVHPVGLLKFSWNYTCTRPQLWGAKGGSAPLNKNFAPPPKLPFPCGSFRMVAFFFGNQQRTRRKVDRIGAMTIFFLRSTENSEKTRPAEKFWPL